MLCSHGQLGSGQSIGMGLVLTTGASEVLDTPSPTSKPAMGIQGKLMACDPEVRGCLLWAFCFQTVLGHWVGVVILSVNWFSDEQTHLAYPEKPARGHNVVLFPS